MKSPITLLVDDPCPIIHVFRDHWVDVHHKPPTTADGRELHETIPNAFLDRFCDVMVRRGIRGKFSIVPAPSGKGDVVRGIEGHPPEETFEWMETAKRRLGPICDFCPEMLTHNLAANLETGGFFSLGESEWSQTQDRTTLLPYIERALGLLEEAGIECTGVTSPWVFGQKVLSEYEWSIVEAFRNVYGREPSWYFLHMLWDRPGMRPWVANGSVPPPLAPEEEGGRGVEVPESPSPAPPSFLASLGTREGSRMVAIPATVRDHWWATIDSPRDDTEWIDEIASKMLSEDGQRGDLLTVLEAGGWPVVLTHWQSLYSNGVESGLAVLDLLGQRVAEHLSDRVEWVTCSEMAARSRSVTMAG